MACSWSNATRTPTVRAGPPSRGRVPDPDGAVAAGGRQAVAVGAERHPPDAPLVAAERQRLLAGGGVPDLDRMVLAGRGEAAAVGAEGDVEDRVGVAAERGQLPT